MGETSGRADVLDAGALIAFERGAKRARAFVQRARAAGIQLIIPAPVLAQVWRGGARQAQLAALVEARATLIEPFDEPLAKAAGILCGRSGTSDIVDASVVISARLHHAVVLTSDPDDLRRIDPSIELESL